MIAYQYLLAGGNTFIMINKKNPEFQDGYTT